MGFDMRMRESRQVLRRAAIPFLAGVAAATAWLHGLYATALLSLLVALWAAAVIQQTVARRQAPPAPVMPAPVMPAASPVDRAERRRLLLYLDLSPAPLVMLDADDRLRAINRAARRLLGADDRVPTPPAHLVEAIGATPPGRAATVRVDTGGGERAFALLTTDLDAGLGTARVAALVDIDADLKAAEAATLRDLVQVLSHEITNTLTPIASLSATAAAMLADPVPDHAAARSAVETVARRAQGLQRFGAAYRDLARLPPPTRVRTDGRALVADLAQLFAARWPTITFHWTAPDTPLPIDADADQLSQALWALLQNAAEMADAVTLAVDMRANSFAFRIGDDGPGVPEANVHAIFQPFFTTKAEGSGVGLALARQIFRGHGGDLVLRESAPGRTLFEGVVPITRSR